MIQSNVLSLLFVVPVFVIVGYFVYLMINLSLKPPKDRNSTLSYVFKLYTDPKFLEDEISADLFIPPESLPSFDSNEFTTDPVSSQLDSDAHAFALNSFCLNSIDLKTNYAAQACEIATEAECALRSAPDGDITLMLASEDNDFLRWQADVGCFRDYGNGNSCKGICPQKTIPCTQEEFDRILQLRQDFYDDYLLKNDLSKDLFSFDDFLTANPVECSIIDDESKNCETFSYVAPKIKCEADGLCSTVIPEDYGKCVLTEQYCLSKGETYSSTGLGDCYETDIQGVSEMLIGKFVTRTYKKSYENVVKNCQNVSPNDPVCALSVATLVFLPAEIVFEAVVAEYTQTIEAIKTDCRIGVRDASKLSKITGPQCFKCIQSIAELWPGFFVADKLNEFVNTLIRAIPGGALFKGIDIFGFQSILEFGGKALDAVFKFGADAGKSFNVAGQNMIGAYDRLMNGGSLKDFALDETLQLVNVAKDVLVDCAQLGLAVLQAGASVALGVFLQGYELLQIAIAAIGTGCSALATYITTKIGDCGEGKTLTECIQEIDGDFLGAIFGAFAQGLVSALEGLSIGFDWLANLGSQILSGIRKFSCFFLSC
jgi:hypothetical protein